ncbi:unnamed protein product [Caenorhabditis auriculariae]|uniref:Uncharacterized protein n=1 Tax=Caenorhabditis auriculariae TaxID=2777116 RepID=A0A8S1GQC5_9PELO|nr:unnamed protein product [Caenorhabditis auriculariae]
MICRLLFYFSCLYFVSGQAPTCPNGQVPKLDKNLNPIQCLPGTSQYLICGNTHTCYFTGLNYMCCPSNEPSIDNQPTCPYPRITVLDSHGLPLKCSPRTRECPGDRMTCSDVGLGYICCEDLGFSEPKATLRPENRKMKFTTTITTTMAPEEELECPENSIGLLKADGSRVVCNSRKSCPGSDTFCHGEYKRSICCQKYLFAKDILDVTEEPEKVPEEKKAASFIESRNPFKPKSISMAMRTPPRHIHSAEKIGNNRQKPHNSETASKISHGRFSHNSRETEGNKKNTDSATVWKSVETETEAPTTVKSTTTSTTTTTTTTTTTHVPLPAATYRSSLAKLSKVPQEVRRKPVPNGVIRRNRLHGIQTSGDAEFRPPTATLRSETMNQQDKHAIAQQLLSYQIRNGWPYDERFYRPDVDTFDEEQKANIARMQFINQQ